MLEKIRCYLALPVVVALAGCAGGFHHVTPAGQQVDFKKPMLTQSERQGGLYILLEKSIADGKYKLLDVSPSKQKIANSRQERVVFTSDLQKYAVDFDDYEWETYVDRGNYDQKSEIMRCTPAVSRDKTVSYNPCSSDFKDIFVPFGITKAYAAGHLAQSVKQTWEDPRQNNRVTFVNPWSALSDSGAVAKLGIKRVEK